MVRVFFRGYNELYSHLRSKTFKKGMTFESTILLNRLKNERTVREYSKEVKI
jgi:hypothetical protein